MMCTLQIMKLTINNFLLPLPISSLSYPNLVLGTSYRNVYRERTIRIHMCSNIVNGQKCFRIAILHDSITKTY